MHNPNHSISNVYSIYIIEKKFSDVILIQLIDMRIDKSNSSESSRGDKLGGKLHFYLQWGHFLLLQKLQS